jgi:PKD repeat protein
MLRHLLATTLGVASLVAQSPLYSGVQPTTPTTFVGGLVWTNTNPPPVTQLFDVTITNPAGLTVTQFECNSNASAGTNGTLGVWVTALGGSHVNNQMNSGAWTQVGTASRTHAGGRVAFLLNAPFYLAAGTYGMALHYVGCNPVYTNPATPIPNLPTTYSNADATFTMSGARVRPSDPLNPFGGTNNGASPRHPNIAMSYVTGAVSVDFTATPTLGASPLAVQFTSIAYSGNPGGILAYAWDFDGDNVTDSTLPNPLHVYTACGDYTVSLLIADAVGSATVTKANFVRTDIVVPSFTTQLLAPGVVQFTDTSSPTPQSWAWDLDGDTVVDSTQQNPFFVYPNGCAEVPVTLTTTLACRPPVTLNKRIAVASALETTFQSGLIINTTVTSGANFLDANVTNPTGITVCGMHVNSNVAANSPVTVNVWQKSGTYVGFVDNAAVWRLVGTAAATSRGLGQRTFATFASPIYLAPGLHGLAIEQVGGSPVYTNLGTAQTYTNADVSITAGLVQAPPLFGPAATSTQYTPRVWNGAIYYGTSTTNQAGGYGYIGAGCAGALGVPGNVAQTQPVVGTSLAVNVDRLPANVAFFLVGFSDTQSQFGPLPLDLAAFGAPNCPARVSPDATVLLLGLGNTATWNFNLPAATGLIGVRMFTQALALDPAANVLGAITSDAAAMLIGN